MNNGNNQENNLRSSEIKSHDNNSVNPDIVSPQQLEQKLQIIAQSIEFSGPLPHPHILRQYNEILPGAAERILTMAETQSLHRQTLEKSVIKNDNFKSILGLIFAFIIALLGLCGGMLLAYHGHPFFGSSVSILVLAALVSTFIYGTNKKSAELKQKDKETSEETTQKQE